MATLIVHLTEQIHRSVELVREFKQLEETVELHPLNCIL